MPRKYEPISLQNVRTYPLKSRKSKVSLDKLGKPFYSGTFASFLESLPDILAARDFRSVVNAIITARKNDRPVILGMGAHPIKAGLSPLIISLMENEVVTAIAMNGAGIVHDFELACTGETSEDVDAALCKGTFGMAEETGRELNRAITAGVRKGDGIGLAVGRHIMKGAYPYAQLSVLGAAVKQRIPATVHVALGTDIIHMHPEADGKSIGEGSMRDFRLFCSVVADLRGGVYINLGSAVILPEVFLKAIGVSRNLKYKVKNFTTVNMDFIQHYRARENVLRRPTLSGGNAYALTGHHEIMFPLLAAAVLDRISL